MLLATKMLQFVSQQSCIAFTTLPYSTVAQFKVVRHLHFGCDLHHSKIARKVAWSKHALICGTSFYNVTSVMHNVWSRFILIIIYSDENQEECSDVSVITTNEDFTQSVNTRNLYSYQAELDAKIDQEVAMNYKVEIRYNF